MASTCKQPMVICTILLLLNSFSRSSHDAAAAEKTFSNQAAFATPLQPYECPYPCLPPPTATTTNCPPPPPSPLPPYGWLYPPPAYVNNYFAPPPPNPILPYFPFYYKNPPPPFGFSSAGGPSPLGPCCIIAFMLQILTRLL